MRSCVASSTGLLYTAAGTRAAHCASEKKHASLCMIQKLFWMPSRKFSINASMPQNLSWKTGLESTEIPDRTPLDHGGTTGGFFKPVFNEPMCTTSLYPFLHRKQKHFLCPSSFSCLMIEVQTTSMYFVKLIVTTWNKSLMIWIKKNNNNSVSTLPRK